MILHSRASLAVNFLPNNVISLKLWKVLCFFLMTANIPGGKGKPMSTSLQAKMAFQATMIESWAKANMQPPATAPPLTKAKVGIGKTDNLPNRLINSKTKNL